MEPARPLQRSVERLALALLVVGCAIGFADLLRRPSLSPAPSASPQELRQRIHELEGRLLEQVPQAIERRYYDH